MLIEVKKLGRRFNRDWVFRNLNQTFTLGNSYAVLGPNGSGKSTLLQVISGSLTPSEGEISYVDKDKEIPIEDAFRVISMAAPYLELIEEFTLKESIAFHFKFKKYQPELSCDELIKLLNFEKFTDRQVRYFSSGMKQRLKLMLAVASDTPVLLLDEPTANLDMQGVEWYLQLIQRFSANRLLIIGSNQAHEYSFCEHQISLLDFK